MGPKANNPPKHHPHRVISRARSAGIRDVIVSFSGGKDAIATLDLCCKHFRRVEAFFMVAAPRVIDGRLTALPHEEKQLAWAERRFRAKIHRVPHHMVTLLFRESTFRHGTVAATECAKLKPADVDAYVRKITGLKWIATGERARDSLERNAFIKETGGIDRLNDQEQRDRDAEYEQKKGTPKKKLRPRFRLYPIGFWNESDVFSYLSRNRLPVPSVYQIVNHSYFQRDDGKKSKDFGGLQMETVAYMRDFMPEDYAAIKSVFPLIEAQVCRWEAKQRKESRRNERSSVVKG